MPRPPISGPPPHTPIKVAALRPRSIVVDAGLLAAIFGIFSWAVLVAREWGGPPSFTESIDLHPSRLPVYTLYSLARGIVAYTLSLTFTIAYGKAASSSQRAERVLMPILDILQAIPVLSFMPGLVLGLVGLFPSSNLGLELACVLAIFTGQVWNMAFSFHASLRAIPLDQVEVARMNGFRPLKRLFSLELPSAMNGLVWNSMMSMAGGWFFLTIVEAFTLQGRAYRLPGLGSYMAAAVEAGDGAAMAWAVLAMIVMIVAVDQLIWRPLIVWAERFRNEDVASSGRARSWFLDLIRGSRLARLLRARAMRTASHVKEQRAERAERAPRTGAAPATILRSRVAVMLAIALLAAICVLGAFKLVVLLLPLGASDWSTIGKSLLWTAIRVLGALLIGAAWTVPVGFLIGRSQKLSNLLLPVIQVFASFPAPMLYPIVVPMLLRAGVGSNLVATMLMALGTQWYVLFNVAAGAAAVPHDLREVASVFRTPRMKRILLVEFGSIFPFLVTGMLTAAGGAWNASIVSEAVRYPGGESDVDGIGALIARSFESGSLPTLAAATLCVAAALVLINRLVWKPLQRLATSRFALNR